MNNYNDDYIQVLELELEELNSLIEFCKVNNYSQSIIFILTSLLVKKRDNIKKLL